MTFNNKFIRSVNTAQTRETKSGELDGTQTEVAAVEDFASLNLTQPIVLCL
jgi:hypothetical protein